MTPDVRHKHLIVRAEIASPPYPEGPADAALVEVRVENWVRDLIACIDMKVMYGPKAKYCFVEGNRGMTAFAIIETSHICLHVWDECKPAIIQLDVYTCSDLNVDDVIKTLDVFEPSKIEYKFLDRENGLTLISEGDNEPSLWKRFTAAFWRLLKGLA